MAVPFCRVDGWLRMPGVAEWPLLTRHLQEFIFKIKLAVYDSVQVLLRLN
jgi:hypothetical protein